MHRVLRFRWPAALALALGSLPALLSAQAAPAPLRGPAHHRTQAPPPHPCVAFVAGLPNVKRPLCEAAALRATEGRSVQGRTLYARDVVAPGSKLRVLVIGAIHGDELSSASLALHWIQHAVQSPSNAHWRFIPALNPDGLLARPARRTNASGVDLNRNFPTPNWRRDAKVYWEQRTRKDPRRWPGPNPLSEPETRYLHDEMARFQPHLIVSIHAPYGVLDFDGPGVPPPQLGRLYLDQVGIFPGSLGNYGGVHQGMPVVTIELPNAFRTPLDAEMREMWLDLQRWMGERLEPGAPPQPRRKSG
ncbi:M14 family zinc carboxypeptidase [Hydrogenophaga sp.]|uniref:M14 family zinc carboxypeptidase n=1 Tax=Hydrogenophaga sp. TaxID=1904254 RepID=UPI003F723388